MPFGDELEAHFTLDALTFGDELEALFTPPVTESHSSPVVNAAVIYNVNSFGSPVVSYSLAYQPTQYTSPAITVSFLSVGVRGIKGKQFGNLEVTTIKLKDNVFSSTILGRKKMANSYFDLATATNKFSAGAVPLDRIQEAPLPADGSDTWITNHDAGGFRLTSVDTTPTDPADIATKSYTDSFFLGLHAKSSVRVATNAALPANTATGSGIGKFLQANANGVLTVDGVAVVLGDRILVKNEVAGQHNGIYTVTTLGTASVRWILTRATDFDEAPEVVPGSFMFVSQGVTWADTGFVMTANDPITVDTTPLTFDVFSSQGAIQAGGGLTRTDLTIDLVQGAGLSVTADVIQAVYGNDGEVDSIQPDDAASAGVLAKLARVDHQHAVATDTATSITPNTGPAEGVATSFTRSDHTHVVPTDGPADLGLMNAAGVIDALARADHVHRAPHWAKANKDEAPQATLGNEAYTGLTIATTPALSGYVFLVVNRFVYIVGNGSKTADAYYSGDGGTTARAFGSIVAGDGLYWNGTLVGHNLSPSDLVSQHYRRF